MIRQKPFLQVACLRAVRTKLTPKAEKTCDLARCLKLRDLIGFGLGTTIGGGIFVAIGIASVEAGPSLILSFVVAAMVCLCSGYCYAEMACSVPSSGGSYSFTYNAVGELPAFIVGVFVALGNMITSAAVSRGWASYLNMLLIEIGFSPPTALVSIPLGHFEMNPLALAIVLVLGAVCLRGTNTTASFNNAFTACSVILLLSFTFGSMHAVDSRNWKPFFPSGAGGVLRGAALVFFAFIGFDVVACLGDETEDPQIVPLGILGTLGIATVLYVATATVFTGLVSREEVDVHAPLAAASHLRGLDVIALIIAFGAVGNTTTSVIGGFVAAPRICFSMAQDGLLPNVFGTVDAKGTPRSSLCLSISVAAALAGFVDFSALADCQSVASLGAFSLVCVSALLHRCQKSTESPGDGVQVSDKAQNGAATGSVPKPAVLGCTSENGDVSLETVVTEVEAAGAAQPEMKTSSRVAKHLGVFAVLSLACGFCLENPALFGGMVLMTFVSGVLVWHAYCYEARVPAGDGYRAPLMPLPSLLGVFMNAILFTRLPLEAVRNSIVAALLCLALYFGYAAPRSKLESLSYGRLEEPDYPDDKEITI